ncbi:MAG: carboxypeptidase regulatory-like domain-containing protein, partial [Candidatus Acidiferrales bacterium]
EYASQLLALAQTLKGPDWRFSLALAIARPSNLERRFAAMLDSSISRNSLSLRAGIFAAFIGVCLLLPLAAVSFSAEAPRESAQGLLVKQSTAPPAARSIASDGAAVFGRVIDQTGLPIRAANVTLISGEISHSTKTGANGGFLFSDLVPREYTLHVWRLRLGHVQSRSVEVPLPDRTTTKRFDIVLADPAAASADSLVSAAPHANDPPTSPQATASSALGSVSGTVGDPSGATVPGAIVTLVDVATGQQEQVTANAVGEFVFSNVIPDNYQLSVQQPGFKVYKQQLQLLPNEGLKLPELLLSVGAVTQTVEVSASPSGPTNSQNTLSAMVPVLACPAALQAAQPAYSNPMQKQPGPPPTPTRVRVGGNVEMTRLVQQTLPIYPDSARAAGIQGTVVMNAIIGKDGRLLSTCVASGPPLLAPSALDAVGQWRYSTALLNGEPVEVMTEIQAIFTLTN